MSSLDPRPATTDPRLQALFQRMAEGTLIRATHRTDAVARLGWLVARAADLSADHQPPDRSLGRVRSTGDPRDDAALLRGLQRQEPRALRTVTARYGGALLAYATSHLPAHDPALAEGVVGDALVTLWRKADGFRPDSNLRALLFQFVRDRVNTELRPRPAPVPSAVDADPSDSGPNPLADLLARQDLETALTWLQDCSPPEQDVLLLTALGHSTREIAQRLELAEPTVRQHRSRGRAKLRAARNATS